MEYLSVSNVFKLRQNENYRYLLLQKSDGDDELLNVENRNLRSITLRWCHLKQLCFIKCIFQDSDWDSCQVSNCHYRSINFRNSDLSSTVFNHCIFEDVNFQNSSISDVTFNYCSFISCDFNHIGLLDSSFIKCTFTKMRIRQSTSSLNIFKKCSFSLFSLHGNFLYNFMIQNAFQNATMDPLLAASNYGLMVKDLENLDLSLDDLKSLQQSYLDQKEKEILFSIK